MAAAIAVTPMSPEKSEESSLVRLMTAVAYPAWAMNDIMMVFSFLGCPYWRERAGSVPAVAARRSHQEQAKRLYLPVLFQKGAPVEGMCIESKVKKYQLDISR